MEKSLRLAIESAREALAELEAGRIGKAMLLTQRGSAAFHRAQKQTDEALQEKPGINRVSSPGQNNPKPVDTRDSKSDPKQSPDTVSGVGALARPSGLEPETF